MRPFFRYFGSKWMGAEHYGQPRRGLVIEPFAGSAAYSVWWDAPHVSLYDKSSHVCLAWDWLINCSADDVRRLPDAFKSNEEWLALPDGPRQVVGWNVGYAFMTMPRTLKKSYLHYTNTGERTGTLASSPTQLFWSAAVKSRILRQKPLIRDWTVDQLCYSKIPDIEAHWHVDPPYQGKSGRVYEHSDIDYRHLAQWCREREGSVDVCENEGADWLPFKPLYSITTANRARKSAEVVWRNEAVDLVERMSA